MIGRNGERGSGISALAARHYDDDDMEKKRCRKTKRERDRQTDRERGARKRKKILNIYGKEEVQKDKRGRERERERGRERKREREGGREGGRRDEDDWLDFMAYQPL